MEDKDVTKRLMNILEQTEKRRIPKDLKTALLLRVNRTHHQNINVEFFECLEDIRQIKSDLLIRLKDDGKKSKKEKKKSPEEELIENITKLLKGTIGTPRPKIDSTGTKYQFKEGSEARFEDYENVKNTVREDILFDMIMKLNNLFSEGLGLLGVKEASLWQRDDMIEEVNPEETTEGEDGRGATDTGTDSS